jgi:uncharacterized membrane protein YeaQ/YmgE (transglycosylase-associated protein family)
MVASPMTIVVLLILIIALILVGGFVVGLTLKLLGWVLVGLIVGALARLVVPGRQALGWLATILFGLGGSLIGGILGDVFGFGGFLQFLLAVVVAALLIALFAAGAPRRAAT